MPVLIENNSGALLTLPPPLRGVLASGQRVVVEATQDQLLAAFGPHRLSGVKLRVTEEPGDPYYTGSMGAVAAPVGGYSESFGAALQWVVNHNLGRYPSSVSVRTLGGNLIEVEARHLSSNQVIVSFSNPVAGVVEII